MPTCPCGSKQTAALCCSLFISGQQMPATPVELMRSRYTAYTQANIEYIERTMKAPANKDFDPESARAWAQAVQWQKLEVLSTHTKNHKGFVEFMVFYLHNNKHFIMHELSEFQFVDKQWYYVDGKAPEKKSRLQKK
jgi:SEC-C motif-containing protein